jgi:hypothetical protein
VDVPATAVDDRDSMEAVADDGSDDRDSMEAVADDGSDDRDSMEDVSEGILPPQASTIEANDKKSQTSMDANGHQQTLTYGNVQKPSTEVMAENQQTPTESKSRSPMEVKLQVVPKRDLPDPIVTVKRARWWWQIAVILNTNVIQYNQHGSYRSPILLLLARTSKMYKLVVLKMDK